MRTGRKLALGFGALLLILLLTALVILGRLEQLESRIHAITAIAEPAAAATYEMQIGVAGIGVTVLRYTDAPSPELREKAADHGRAFRQGMEHHERLAPPPQRQDIDQRIGELFREYEATGLELMEGTDRRRRLSEELARGFGDADRRVHEGLSSGIDGAGADGAEKLEVATSLRTGLTELGSRLGRYTRTLTPAHRARLVDSVEELGADLARFEALNLTPAERRLAESVRGPLQASISRVGELVALEEAEQERLSRFLDLGAELDAALVAAPRLPAERDLLAATESTQSFLRVIRVTAFLLLAGGLLAGAATALALGRGILRAEKELKAERERLRVTLSSIGDGVIVTDASGRVTFVNAVAHRLTGWTSHEAEGRPLGEVFRVVDEARRQPVEDPVVRVLRRDAGATRARHMLLVDREGRETPIDDSAAPMLDPGGAVCGAVLVFRDVSERRRSDRLVAEALRYAQGAVENLWVPLLVLDPNLRVKNASRSFYETFRVRPEDTEGRTLDELGEGQWDVPRLGALLAEVLPRNTDIRHFEVEADFPGLGRRTMQLDASRFAGRQGADELILLAIEDITERRELEQALQQRTLALEEADRRKDEFLAMLGHELRNPLAPIRNCLEILRSAALDASGEECREMMERQVRHLTRLTDDLLDVSRITRGRIELRRTRVDLRDVVRSGVEAIAPRSEDRGHGTRVVLGDSEVPIDGDPLRLGQVVTNLLDNAVRYSEEGGAVTVSVATEDGAGVLRVRDEGIGVEASMLTRIFEPFVQADSSLVRARGGLGIGLALVKSLVEMHGGRVSAASDGPGTGCELTVRLPLATAARGAAAPGTVEDASPGRARRVLVVEDNRDAAESLSLLLTLAGHEVRLAHDGSTAVSVARAYRPEVVLLDIGLPGMDGFHVARRLREEPGVDDALLVAMTGYGQAEDRRRSQEAGFDRHLTKPVEPAVLRDLLRDLDVEESRRTG